MSNRNSIYNAGSKGIIRRIMQVFHKYFCGISQIQVASDGNVNQIQICVIERQNSHVLKEESDT